MDLTDMRNQLLKCDMDKTFAFISYSSEDKESVWADVIELQRRGYNLWIDEANLDKSKDSWKEDALSAIEDYDCELVVFYVSKHSLTSSSCLDELKKTTDEMTVKSHFDKVDFVAVEVESIDNIGVYMRTISKEIRSSDLERNEKKQRTYTLSTFQSDWFPENNERVRIHAKDKPGRIGDYYDDIEIILQQKNIFVNETHLLPVNTRLGEESDTAKIIETLLNKSADVYHTVTSYNGRFSFFECNDRLFPAARPIQSKYSKSDENVIADISKFYLEQGNLLLVGEGGIGKTTSLLKAWKDIVENPQKYSLIPFYVPLNEANNISDISGDSETSFIIDYLHSYYEISLDIDSKLVQKITQHHYNIILLLDGFNEISNRNIQIAISNEVKKLSQKLKIRLIMTSRFDFIHIYGLENFQRYSILPLENRTIREYLESENIKNVNISYSLIANPMMLMLFTNMCNIKEHISESIILPFADNNTKGELIYNFIYCQIGKDFRIDRTNDIYLVYVALFLVCPYIANDIEKKGEFSFEYKLISEYVKSALYYYQNDYQWLIGRDLFSLFGYEMFELSIQPKTIQKIIKILLEDIVILQNDGMILLFRHQYFRDFFSAWYIINDIEISLKNKHRPQSLVDRIIPEFIACFVGDCTHDYKCVSNPNWENLLSKLIAELDGDISNEAYMVLNNVISVNKLARNNNLSSVRFSGLDLSHISLNGVKLSTQTRCADFDNCIISSGTFLSQGHTGHVRSAIYNKDGTMILSAGDTTIKLWNCVTGQCMKTFFGHTNLVNTACFHPSEKKILSAANDNTVREWDIDTRECLHTFNDHTGYVTRAIYDSTGDKILSCSWDGTVLYYERTDTGWSKPRLVAKHGMNIKSICFKCDDRTFITASGDSTVREWNLDGMQKMIYQGHTDMVNSAIYAMDDSYVISGGYDNTVRIFSSENSPTGLAEAEFVIDDINSWVRNVVFDGINKKLAVAVHDGIIYEYSLSPKNGCQLISKYVGHKKAVINVSLSSDGMKVVSTSEDGTIREWDRKSNQCIHIYNGIDLSMTDTVYSSDGHLVLTIKDCEYTISKRTDGIPIFKSEKLPSAITSAVFGRDTDTIIYSTEEGLFLRDIKNMQPECLINARKERCAIKNAQYDFYNQGIIAIGIKNDSKSVVFVLLDSEIEAKEFTIPFTADFVKFYGDTQFITFSAGGIIRIWDLETGKEVGILGVDIQNCVFKNCQFEDEIIKKIINEAGGSVK